MSWSFYLKNGDLSFAGPGGFTKVTGQQKLVQDLKLWILTVRGTDPMHPDYGSVLGGGTNPDGSVSTGFIGELITSELLLDIETEVRRVLTAYQQQQLNRLNSDMAQYGKNTFTPGEILSQILAVNLTPLGDTVIVQCVIQTADGSQISFTQAIS